MSVFMIRSHFKPENRDEIIKRYAANPEAGEGITQLGDWVSVVGDGAYHIMEADDAGLILNELLKYSDLCTYTVEPVITAEEFFSLLDNHSLAP